MVYFLVLPYFNYGLVKMCLNNRKDREMLFSINQSLS